MILTMEKKTINVPCVKIHKCGAGRTKARGKKTKKRQIYTTISNMLGKG